MTRRAAAARRGETGRVSSKLTGAPATKGAPRRAQTPAPAVWPQLSRRALTVCYTRSVPSAGRQRPSRPARGGPNGAPFGRARRRPKGVPLRALAISHSAHASARGRGVARAPVAARRRHHSISLSRGVAHARNFFAHCVPAMPAPSDRRPNPLIRRQLGDGKEREPASNSN